MTSRLFTLAAAALIPAFMPGIAQLTRGATPLPATDASWAKTYASGCGAAMRRCPPSTNGYENELNGDPRLASLLRSSFPQHQWFWYDHYKFTPLPDVIQTFIGVPGGALLDEDRYLTASGCVPHDCTSRGMLWIDTAAHPAKLIFVATGDVGTGPGDKSTPAMLWVFSSSKLNWQQIPQPFLDSLHRWHNDLIEQDREGHAAWIDEGGFLMANLVQPTGEIVVIAPSVLGLEPAASGAK